MERGGNNRFLNLQDFQGLGQAFPAGSRPLLSQRGSPPQGQLGASPQPSPDPHSTNTTSTSSNSSLHFLTDPPFYNGHASHPDPCHPLFSPRSPQTISSNRVVRFEEDQAGPDVV